MRFLGVIAAASAVVIGFLSPPAAAEGRLAVTALDAALHGERLRIGLGLTQTPEFGVFTLDEPRRLVVDLPALDWQAGEGVPAVPYLANLRRGLFRPGEARLVFDLDRPVRVVRAFTLPPAPGRDARLVIDLAPTDARSFAASAGWPESRRWTGATGTGRLLVALDPGHGGHDPGAMVDGLVEKDLVMDFAREMAEAIAARPGLDAVMTRDGDSYVPLDERIDRAREAGAGLMISLHADRLAEGEADGVSIYSLGLGSARGRGGDALTAALIRSADRASLVQGSDLAGVDDALARLVVGLGRRATAPDSERLAASLLEALEGEVALLASRPHRHGAFAVLKAADLPAVLVELGFLDSEMDRNRFRSDGWRRRTISAIIRGIEQWAGANPEPAMALN